MSQRIELVIRVVRGGESVSKICEEFGISRMTAHTWLRRYRESKSFTALEDRSRAPHQVKNRTPQRVVDRILELRAAEKWSGRKIQRVLSWEGIAVGSRTIDRILDRSGCIQEVDRHAGATKRFEREKPNELWQVDFKGQYRSPDGDCYPLSILDDHSRYATGLYALRGTSGEPVRECFIATFQAYGVPDQMLMDHGTPWWASNSERGLTQVSVMLIQQGVRLSYSGIGHPQTQGKVERFHRTLSDSLKHRGVPQQIHAWQSRLDEFRKTYNEIRPHEALDMQVPKDRYCPSPRSYVMQPLPWKYGSEWTTAEVNSQGSVSYGTRRFFISRALAHETVGLQEVDGKVIVRYRHMYVRQLDLETGDTQPLIANTAEGCAN